MGQGGDSHNAGAGDPILTLAVEQDTVPWYKKRNLRYLYLMLVPTCMGIEITSGWDSGMIKYVLPVRVVSPTDKS
ncbi:hypothetical protein LTR95_016213 [Oleoguttula sp. CCFEE 5521]